MNHQLSSGRDSSRKPLSCLGGCGVVLLVAVVACLLMPVVDAVFIPEATRPKVVVGTSGQIQASMEVAQMTTPFTGRWVEQSTYYLGQPSNEPFHLSWTFNNSGWVEMQLPDSPTPIRHRVQCFSENRFRFFPGDVWNGIGFSGRWKHQGDELIVFLNTGSEFPHENSTAGDVETQMVMIR